MVRHHLRVRESGWRRQLIVNAVGAVSTFVVLLVIAVTKCVAGAWIPIVLVPMTVVGFELVRRHYNHLGQALAVSAADAVAHPETNVVLVLVGQVHSGVLKALNYARGLEVEHLIALHVCIDEDDGSAITKRWQELDVDVPLELTTANYRDLGPTIESYVDGVMARWPRTPLTIVTSQDAGGGTFDNLLHNQSLVLLAERLMLRAGVVVTTVPYRI